MSVFLSFCAVFVLFLCCFCAVFVLKMITLQATCYRSRFETMCFGMNEAGATHCSAGGPCGVSKNDEIDVKHEELCTENDGICRARR